MKPRVWAPDAGTVEVQLADGREPLRKETSGWHVADVDVPAGGDYAFLIDGGDPRPDPRSPWQPEGIHGPSRVVDHAAHGWTDGSSRPAPLSDQVIYEMHVGTFTPEGTFDSAVERLGHLVDLGVTAVEILPVAQFPGRRGWGYDGVDLYAPHDSYGGPDALKRLVGACHARGLAAILDVVYNHLGPDGNYLRSFGPYFSDRYATPWGEAVNLDGPDSDEVRAFFIDNACMWLRDYHFDGLRLDAVHAIVDTSAVHFLEELSIRVAELSAQLGRDPWLIAESDLNDPRVVRPRDCGGYGIHAQWSDDFHHALHALLTGERTGYYRDFGTVGHLAKALRQAYVYDGIYSVHRRRRHGRSPAGLSGHNFLAYMQNHDQIGNRARGERSSALMSADLLRVAAALVMTSPFVPMLFHGEEWGARTPWMYFTAHQDPNLGRAVTEGRIREFAAFGWRPEDVPDPQDPRTFEASKLDWSELDQEHHAAILEWHRQLIRLRRTFPALSDGAMEAVSTSQDEDRRWLVVERGPVAVACNFSGTSTEVPLDVSRSELVIASRPPERAGDGPVRMAPESVAVWSADEAAGDTW